MIAVQWLGSLLLRTRDLFAKFAHFNKTYGVLGAAIALLVWLYWTAFIVLLGGGTQPRKSSKERCDWSSALLKQPPPEKVRPLPSDSAQLAA